MKNITQKEIYLITCERRRLGSECTTEIVLGAFMDEKLAQKTAEQLFQKKRAKFIEEVQSRDNFDKSALSAPNNCHIVSYGKGSTLEFLSVHVMPNYLLTDM